MPTTRTQTHSKSK